MAVRILGWIDNSDNIFKDLLRYLIGAGCELIESAQRRLGATALIAVNCVVEHHYGGRAAGYFIHFLCTQCGIRQFSDRGPDLVEAGQVLGAAYDHVVLFAVLVRCSDYFYPHLVGGLGYCKDELLQQVMGGMALPDLVTENRLWRRYAGVVCAAGPHIVLGRKSPSSQKQE